MGVTSPHFAGSLGREHIYRELYVVSWWEPYICVSQPCVSSLWSFMAESDGLFVGVCSS